MEWSAVLWLPSGRAQLSGSTKRLFAIQEPLVRLDVITLSSVGSSSTTPGLLLVGRFGKVVVLLLQHIRVGQSDAPHGRAEGAVATFLYTEDTYHPHLLRSYEGALPGPVQAIGVATTTSGVTILFHTTADGSGFVTPLHALPIVTTGGSCGAASHSRPHSLPLQSQHCQPLSNPGCDVPFRSHVSPHARRTTVVGDHDPIDKARASLAKSLRLLDHDHEQPSRVGGPPQQHAPTKVTFSSFKVPLRKSLVNVVFEASARPLSAVLLYSSGEIGRLRVTPVGDETGDNLESLLDKYKRWELTPGALLPPPPPVPPASGSHLRHASEGEGDGDGDGSSIKSSVEVQGRVCRIPAPAVSSTDQIKALLEDIQGLTEAQKRGEARHKAQNVKIAHLNEALSWVQHYAAAARSTLLMPSVTGNNNGGRLPPPPFACRVTGSLVKQGGGPFSTHLGKEFVHVAVQMMDAKGMIGAHHPSHFHHWNALVQVRQLGHSRVSTVSKPLVAFSTSAGAAAATTKWPSLDMEVYVPSSSPVPLHVSVWLVVARGIFEAETAVEGILLGCGDVEGGGAGVLIHSERLDMLQMVHTSQRHPLGGSDGMPEVPSERALLQHAIGTFGQRDRVATMPNVRMVASYFCPQCVLHF